MPSSLTVVPIPCLRDNYAYLVFDPNGDERCLVVDPSEAGPVEAEVLRRGLELGAIVNTHHHWDHVGGNRELANGRQLDVVVSERDVERIEGATRGISHGQRFTVLGWEFSALHVPGHTQGSMVVASGDVAFVGDTLFGAGCGRLLEGTAHQLHNSLTRVMSELPDVTQIYSGHEYTLSNLNFALTIWRHEALEARASEVASRRAQGQYCASASLGVERRTNPFLLCHRPELQQALGAPDEFSAFVELRKRKDNF